jgi:hypothetical protein
MLFFFIILFSRIALIILLYSSIIAYNNLYLTFLDKGTGLYTKPASTGNERLDAEKQ